MQQFADKIDKGVQMITVVGMGRKQGDITADGQRAIMRADVVVVKSNLTHAWKAVAKLRDDALSCDEFYEKATDFDQMNADIAAYLRGFGDKNVAFCVVGQGPEDTVVQLLDEADIVYGVPLYGPAVGKVLPTGCVQYLAADIVAAKRVLPLPTVVACVDDKYVASDVQLRLYEAFDPDTPVTVVHGDAAVVKCTLDELTKQKFDYRTCVCIMPKPLTERRTFDYYDCTDILTRLRAPNGCPWDREQTHKSIVKNVIEEAYELANALENDDTANIVEELGDLLMQAMFHIEIAKEGGEFEPQDVYSALACKLVDRHPHVFGGVVANNADESLSVWDKQKMKEHKIKGVAENVLDVPRVMASLMRCQKIQSRAAKGGYEFADIQQILDKIREETEEFLAASDVEAKQNEGGDLLFSVVNLLRKSGVDSETALIKSTEKFVSRVVECERLLAERGTTLKALTAEQFDELWDEVKKNANRM